MPHPRASLRHRLLALLLPLALLAPAAHTALAQPAAPPAPAPTSQSVAPKGKVLCWYMVCFGMSVEGYKQEIELAQRHGIDGFLLDVGEWQHGKPDAWKPTNYVQSADRMFEAAKQLNTGFVLAMAPEYSVQPFQDNVQDMVMRYKDHPNQFKSDGKPVLSGYAGGHMFQGLQEKLKAAGVTVCFVPNLFPPRFLTCPSIETFQDEFAALPMDGYMMFNPSLTPTVIGDNANGCRASQKLGKIFAAGVCPAYNSANLTDMRGVSGYIDQWHGAINDGADWISLVIWNDYNEDSGLMPGRWPFGAERDHFDRDETFLDVNSFVSAWFKSGKQPEITQDKMYLTYRNRSKWLRKGWNGKEWVEVNQMASRFDQIHDDIEDNFYIDTFLTAPAAVTLDIAGKKYTFEMPAGIGHAEAPLSPGVPELTLSRDKKPLATVIGRKEVIDKPTEKNSFTGYHLLNRTWTNGTAIGPIVKRIEAESGTLEAGATIVTEGNVKAVQNKEEKGSGFTVPVTGLTTATYNVRITYSNPSNEEARLELIADGPARNKGERDYFIPAFLPRTGGKFKTVSFFWSLYDTTTTIKMLWRAGEMFGQPKPEDNDRGTPLIDAIELVKVEPVKMPTPRVVTMPELIAIPGGKFDMGSSKGEPDELPKRSMTISPFAMGKFEVTNIEFEAFLPEHRKIRNGNSWRDREAVVAVGWVEGAKYCNWLSEKNGLKPAYAEVAVDPAKPKELTWVADPKAEGFRMPTEAEWEYVATGRGEGRTYPWGEAAPVPNVHGRFQGKPAIGPRLPRSATDDAGVVVVGSFPAGASRDGVMDLAGNAGEWCADWYNAYTGDAQTDPVQNKPSNFRSIRGGSWGWYGYSQRASDREFNSQNYPGHAYYGLRVVISEEGFKKLKPAK